MTRSLHPNRCVWPLAAIFTVFFVANANCQHVDDLALPDVISFNAHIRPLMSNTCFVCHGPAGEENPSELRLDSFEVATSQVPSEAGMAIVPGKPQDSLVIERISATDPDERMPPPDFRHQLSDRDQAIFQRWIEQGAHYQQHWAYSNLERPAIPKIKSSSSQLANPIDAFILAKLDSVGLDTSPEAGKAMLLRRLSLDLIGLPPTPAELAAFLDDHRPDAYARQVDRLLASPHYGERMASPWLDIVRFADTVGFHGDQNQRIFSYRDYVINAFNKNKPFDEFTREQLAGDLLSGPDGKGPTAEQLTATGFTRLNMMTREGGAQSAEYLAKYSADRVRALGTAWLGATLGCCECHDHKYDPFSAKDFYSLGAFFNDLRQWGVYTTYGYTKNPDLAGFNNESPFPPELLSQSQSLNERIRYLQRAYDKQIAAELPKQLHQSDAFRGWVATIREFLSSYPDGWVSGSIHSATVEKGTDLEKQSDHSLLFNGKARPGEVTTVELQFPSRTSFDSVRLEVLPDESNGGHIGRGKNGSFQVEVELLVRRRDESTPTAVQVAWAQPDHEVPPRYKSGHHPVHLGKIWKSLPAAWQVPSNGAMQPHNAIFHLSEPLELSEDDRLVVRLKSADIGRVRFLATPLAEAIPGRPAVDQRLAEALSLPESQWRAEDIEAVSAAYYRATTPPDQVSKTGKKFRRAIVDCRAGYSHTLIAQPLPKEQVATARVLPRGNWQDTSGEVVLPNVPHFLPQPAKPGGRRLTRLDLANWLTSTENPLTARHFVNRLWKQFFGAGISNKLDDLGNQGEWPSHPLLLDWLANEFRDSGWDIKHTVKLIVTSHTYRQRSAYRTDLTEIDPYNRLLSQQSARRLDAESIRDNALSVSGLLASDLIGGPSVFPYQPAGYYSNIQFPNRKYKNSTDDRQYRRGVYMHWQRTFLHPMLASFDAPARDECTADRVISNSPQQALTLLNDPTFVEASGAMANKLLLEMPSADFPALLDQAFLRALCRPANKQEHESLRNLYLSQQEYYDQHPTEAAAFQSTGSLSNLSDIPNARLAAFAQVCRVLLNLHETITRY